MRKSRGNRRADPLVERDQVILAEKKLTGNKPVTEVGADMGLPPRTAQRLAAQGLREMLNTPANKLKLEALFSVFISGFAESLEDLQIVIDNYKSRGKLPPIKAVLAKVTTLLAAAKTCGLGNDNPVIQTGDTVAPVNISFTMVGRDGEQREMKLDEFMNRPKEIETHVPRMLQAAPVEFVEPQIVPPTPVADPDFIRLPDGTLRRVKAKPPSQQAYEEPFVPTLRGRKNIEGSGIEDLG